MICTDTYTTSQLESGIMLSFKPPVRIGCDNTNTDNTNIEFATDINPAEEYFYYFDYVRIFPDKPAPTIEFTPASGSYTMRGNKSFSPKIFVKIKTTHSSQIQVLFRMTIKDRYNKILYIDYILIATKSVESFTLNASILNSTNPSNIGPNGGSIIQIADTDLGVNRGGLLGDSTSFNAGNLTLIRAGMEIDGPGIPENLKPIYIKGLIFGTSNQFELTTLIPWNNTDTSPREGLYTFTKNQSCIPPEVIEEREKVGNYIVLNKNNNWKYIFQNRVIAIFYREDQDDEDITIFLPVKNSSLLPNREDSSEIALAPITKIAGRVMGDTQCITEIT